MFAKNYPVPVWEHYDANKVDCERERGNRERVRTREDARRTKKERNDRINPNPIRIILPLST